MRSFRAKVLVLVLLVVLGAQVATVSAVLITANNDAMERAETQLSTGGETFGQIVAGRAVLLSQTVHTLASDFAFKEAISTGETDTIASALINHARRAEADIALLMNVDGNVIASSRGPVTDYSDLSALIADAGGEASRNALIIGSKGYEMLTAPVRAPLPVAWLSMGFAVDDSLAKQIGALAGLQTTFIASTNDGLKLLGSSLPLESRGPIVNATLSVAGGMSFGSAVDSLRDEYLIVREDFLVGPTTVFAVLQKSVSEALEPARALRTAMLYLASVTLLMTLIIGAILSRSVSRPVRDLLLASRRMRVGNYSKKIAFSSRDEFGELANAFNDMQQSIAEREERISHNALHDPLTGLPNRLHAMELMRTALLKCARAEQPLVLLIMHLQRYREIESSLGHEVGEEVLLQTSRRMSESLGPNDVLARLEGDQFLIVLPGANRDAGQATAETLAKLLDSGLTIRNVHVTLDACIGMCVYPEHGRQPDELLRRVAVAKTDAQQAHKSVHIYQIGREARHVRQLAILGDLRRAAREDELQLYLQPKITLSDGAVCGAEALLRWSHPELGDIPPAEFVPLAENAGSVGILTEWVLRRSLEQCRQLKDAGIDMPIAVNLSGRDLLNEKLPYLITQILTEQQLDPRYLIVEITEEALVRDIGRAVTVLRYLRKMGTLVSMDDFGTGYSSLGQLKRLPVDEIKIDREFISNLPEDKADKAIVLSVIELAHNLDLELVAEGVETSATLQWIREHGCERAQGFYISKPMPAHQFKTWVDNWRDSGNKADDSLIFMPRLPRKTTA